MSRIRQQAKPIENDNPSGWSVIAHSICLGVGIGILIAVSLMESGVKLPVVSATAMAFFLLAGARWFKGSFKRESSRWFKDSFTLDRSNKK
jgi:hypothetical protein